MKTLSLAIIIVTLFSFQLSAQEETLVGNGEITHGGFGGPVMENLVFWLEDVEAGL